MKQSRSLEALFAGLLVGCGPQVDLEGDETDGDDGGSEGSGTSGASSVSTSVSTTVSTTVSTSVSTSATTATTDPSDSDPTFDEGPGCDTTIYSDIYEVQLSDLEGMLDEGGQVIPDRCWDACGIAGLYEDIVACQLLDVGGSDAGSDGDDGTPPPDGGSSGGPSTTSPTSGPLDTGDSLDDGFETGAGATGLLECEYTYVCFGGRGHAALSSDGRAPAIDPVGRWAAEAAHAEAASVAAFLALHTELSAHGAPMELLDRLLHAARDEVAHARMMTRIAARRGARVRRPRFGPVVVRDLETIAIENAVEGCVRETWAALEASHQARAAVHADVRAAMRRIAEDETRHAELARDIDAWARRRLARVSRGRVAAARGVAVRSLSRSVGRRRDAALYECAGIPRPAAARRLLAGLAAELWA